MTVLCSLQVYHFARGVGKGRGLGRGCEGRGLGRGWGREGFGKGVGKGGDSLLILLFLKRYNVVHVPLDTATQLFNCTIVVHIEGGKGGLCI